MEIKPIPSLSDHSRRLFWSHVKYGSPSDCWLWQGTWIDSHGHKYGVWNHLGFQLYAHRIAYTLTIGPIPDGLTIDHVKARGCTNKLCCNPAHLEAVSHAVNMQRRGSDACACGAPRVLACKNRCRECHNVYFREYQRVNSEKLNANKRARYVPKPQRLPVFE